jgi:hypothetical protein
VKLIDTPAPDAELERDAVAGGRWPGWSFYARTYLPGLAAWILTTLACFTVAAGPFRALQAGLIDLVVRFLELPPAAAVGCAAGAYVIVTAAGEACTYLAWRWSR